MSPLHTCPICQGVGHYENLDVDGHPKVDQPATCISCHGSGFVGCLRCLDSGFMGVMDYKGEYDNIEYCTCVMGRTLARREQYRPQVPAITVPVYDQPFT